ncbi:MAG: tripartite tricarboxylate transporter TctB family protein [Proteobacteria bacterium]|nr:tripartite tricarboxylate transporter TctB family protein [Pseudomonadota bacterium]
MAENTQSADAGGPSQRAVEAGVALGMVGFALVVIVGSLQVGIGWGDEGPKAGFFPFYVGLIIFAASVINLLQARARIAGERLFAEWSALRQVLSVVIPTAIYVAVLPWVGIYFASAVLIGFFMRWLGRYGWALIAAVSVGVPLAFFLVFERWFLVPLPKGPIENLLGL